MWIVCECSIHWRTECNARGRIEYQVIQSLAAPISLNADRTDRYVETLRRIAASNRRLFVASNRRASDR